MVYWKSIPSSSSRVAENWNSSLPFGSLGGNGWWASSTKTASNLNFCSKCTELLTAMNPCASKSIFSLWPMPTLQKPGKSAANWSSKARKGTVIKTFVGMEMEVWTYRGPPIRPKWKGFPMQRLFWECWHSGRLLFHNKTRNPSRHVAHQLFHDTSLASSASHLYLPCTLCTSLQAILLAFPQWWIWRGRTFTISAASEFSVAAGKPVTKNWSQEIEQEWGILQEYATDRRGFYWSGNEIRAIQLRHSAHLCIVFRVILCNWACDLCSHDLDFFDTSCKLLVTRVQFSAWVAHAGTNCRLFFVGLLCTCTCKPCAQIETNAYKCDLWNSSCQIR